MKNTIDELTEILNRKVGHPSNWESINYKSALIMLAQEIDKLKKNHTSGRV